LRARSASQRRGNCGQLRTARYPRLFGSAVALVVVATIATDVVTSYYWCHSWPVSYALVAWNGSWNGGLSNPSPARGCRAMTRAICAATRRRLRRRWPGVSAGLSLSRGSPAHAGPHSRRAHRSRRRTRQAGPYCTGHLPRRTRLSSSRPPRLGRSLRSRRMRSTSPTLDPESTYQDSAPIEEDRGQAGYGEGADSRHAKVPVPMAPAWR
jgi:hypothetical protein